MFVPVTLNGKECHFVLDTGSRGTVLSRSFADSQKLPLFNERQVQAGAGTGAAIRIAEARGVQLSIANRQRAFPAIPVVDLAVVSQAIGRRIDGLLGADLLSQYVLEIDYANDRIRLHSARTFSYQGSGKSFGIGFDQGWITTQLRASVNGVVFTGEFVIDTGAAAPVYFSRPTVERNRLLAKADDLATGIIGVGAGGESKGRVGTAEWLELGPFRINNPTAVFSEDRSGFLGDSKFDGIIGGQILERCKVYVRYSERKLILEPFGNAESYRFDSSGIVFRAVGERLKQFEIVSTLSGTPAHEAGIRRGDRLTRVNDRSTLKMTASQIRELFKQSGSSVDLEIERGDSTRQIQLLLKDYARSR